MKTKQQILQQIDDTISATYFSARPEKSSSQVVYTDEEISHIRTLLWVLIDDKEQEK